MIRNKETMRCLDKNMSNDPVKCDCSSYYNDSILLHLDASDIIDDTCHSDSEEDEYVRMMGVLETDVTYATSDLATPLLESEARAIPLDTPGGSVCYDTNQIGYTRPEFLHARAFKPNKDTPIGVFLAGRRGAIYISRISRDGLFAKSNLRSGDRVMSVNNVSCLHGGATQVAELIKSAETSVSFTVHNKGGNPSLVSSSVQKPSPTRMVGIGFRQKQGALHISRVNTNGLFGDSLLVPGHRCIMINGNESPNTPSRVAAGLVADAREFVTIVCRRHESLALVIACESCKTPKVWYSRVALCFGVAAGVLGAANSMSH
jgi:hypothetical protein